MVLPKSVNNRRSGPKCTKPTTIVTTLIVFLVITLTINIHNFINENEIEEDTSYISTSTSQQSVHEYYYTKPKPKPKLIKDDESSKQWYEKEKPLITEFPIPAQRNDIIPMLEQLKWTTAIEVGVQKGLLAKKMLSNWKSCTEYKLVDLWGKEEGYQEPGGHSQDFHDRAYGETRRRVKPFMDKVEFFVMRSTDAAKKMQDNHFDFVYLDARHDYCAVAEDIRSYWPKVRPGGILAGHDFIDAQYAVSSSV